MRCLRRSLTAAAATAAGLLSALSVVDGKCTARIQARSADLIKTEDQWDNSKQRVVEGVQISRLDIGLITLDVGEEFFFTSEWGPAVGISSCTKGDQVFYPSWQSSRRLAEEDGTILQAGLRLTAAATSIDPKSRPAASADWKLRRLDEPSCVSGCRSSLGREPETCDDVSFVADCVLSGDGRTQRGCGAGADSDAFFASDDYILYRDCLCKGDCPALEVSTCVNACKNTLDHAPADCSDVTTVSDCVFSNCSNDEASEFKASAEYLNIKGCYCEGNRADCDDVGGSSEDPIMACAMTSTCWGAPDFSQGPTCDWLTSMVTCKLALNCPNEEVVKEANALLNTWYACICHGNCDSFNSPTPAPYVNDPVRNPVFDPAEYLNSDEQWGGQELSAGLSFIIPTYERDKLKNYFRYKTVNSNWEVTPYDKFSLFTDFTMGFDATESKCVPLVKLTSDPTESFSRLVSVDGVDVSCMINKMFAGMTDHSSYTEGPMNSPIGWLHNIRRTMRMASGSAPPSPLDDPDTTISVVLMDSSGVESKSEEKLSYSKYMKSAEIVEDRFYRLMESRERCIQVPILHNMGQSRAVWSNTDQKMITEIVDVYDGPFNDWHGPVAHYVATVADTCPRIVNGVESPRIEMNSKASAADAIDKTKLTVGLVMRKQDVLSGSEQKAAYIENFATMDFCAIYVAGLVDAEGEGICDDEESSAALQRSPISEPYCDFKALTAVTEEMSNVLTAMNDGDIPAEAKILLPYLGTDAWGNCSTLIDQALTFDTVEKEIESVRCTASYYNEDYSQLNPVWAEDPCCNYQLQATQCCAPRLITVSVPEASVNTTLLAEYCASDIKQLATAIYAAKSFVETRADSIDPTIGCVRVREEKLSDLRALESIGGDCADEIMGDPATQMSTKICSSDSDCATGSCKVDSGQITGKCQTSMLPEHLVTCIMERLSVYPKAQAVMRDIFTGHAGASNAVLGDALALVAGYETCSGPDGWKFDPQSRVCKSWDDFGCSEYYCEDRDDCKHQCESGESVCNTNPWTPGIDEASCERSGYPGELDTHFCAQCWGTGPSDCYEMSSPSSCTLGMIKWDGNDSDGAFTDDMCRELRTGFTAGTVGIPQWGLQPSACVIDANEISECRLGQSECSEIGYKIEYGCVADLPASGICGEINTPTSTYVNNWYLGDDDTWNPICQTGSVYSSRAAAEEGCSSDNRVSIVGAGMALCNYEEVCYNTEMTEAQCNLMLQRESNNPSGVDGIDWWSNAKLDSYGGWSGLEGEGQLTSHSGASIWWDSSKEKCILYESTEWGTVAGYMQRARNCKSFAFSGMQGVWKWKPSLSFQSGQFDTAAKCRVGVCDIDSSKSEEDCEATFKCNKSNCWGCSKDYSNPNSYLAPNEVCYMRSYHDSYDVIQSMDQATCENTFAGTWSADFERCFIKQGDFGGPSGCVGKDQLYASCPSLGADQCGGGEDELWGQFSEQSSSGKSFIKDMLVCVASSWNECKTEKDCMGAGDCSGGMQSSYSVSEDEGLSWNSSSMRYVCVAPKSSNDREGGYPSCEGYGQYYTVDEVATFCILKTVRNKLDCVSRGKEFEWRSTSESEESCNASKGCITDGASWFYDFDENECASCEGDWKSRNTWSAPSWSAGKMVQFTKWKRRLWQAKNAWKSEIDRWLLQNAVRKVITALQLEIEDQFFQCMYGGMIDSIKKISCVCGMNNESCDRAALFSETVLMFKTTVYEDVSSSEGRPTDTTLYIESDTVDPQTGKSKVEASSLLFVPEPSENVGTAVYKTPDAPDDPANRLRRKLEVDEASLNAAGCYTVVKNANNRLVGQLVGNCVSVTIGTTFANGATLCLATKDAIDVNPLFTRVGVATRTNDKDGSSVYTWKSAATLKRTKHCVTVIESSVLCPIMYAPSQASAEADIGSSACGALDSISQEIAMKKKCTAGDRESCEWLEVGSVSFYAAIGSGIIAAIVIASVIGASCCGFWAHPKSRSVMLKHLNKAFFKEIDLDGNGKLDKNEVKAMLKKEFGEDSSEQLLAEIFATYDKNCDGQLCFAEYKQFISSRKKLGGPAHSYSAFEIGKLAVIPASKTADL